MLAADAPAMDAPAFLAANLSNAAPAFRPQLTLGAQPNAAVLLLEITSRAEGTPTPEPPAGIFVPGVTLGTSASLIAGQASGGAASIVTSGLVMHLDAGNAASYPGSGTAWTDLSGNGNTVTAINSPTWNSGGWFATGATGYFNRASGINVPQGNDPYTLQAWVRKSTWATSGGVMSIGGFGTNNQSNALRTAPGTLGHFIHYWWANDLNALNNTGNISLDTWFMISASFDGTTRKMTVNTIDVASDTPGSGHNVTSSNINVAATLVSNSEYLQGDIAIARIYNRALSAAEIQQNFNANKARFGLSPPPINPTIEYLVIGGGGGGGQGHGAGGGGGAGGLLAGTLSVALSTNYTVTVGAGGPGGSAGVASTSNGSNSVFSSITATGGGGGGGSIASAGNGANGGSGGGAGYAISVAPTAGTGTTGQGNSGGASTGATGPGGGGGGANAVGASASGANGGNGGAGSSSSITGTAVTYAGGGGGAPVNGGGLAGTGGAGGGGNGASVNGTSGSPGSANTGGGGGGASGAFAVGGAGGSGVVILRYPNTVTISNPGGGLTYTTASVGSDTVATFTAGTGNVQWN